MSNLYDIYKRSQLLILSVDIGDKRIIIGEING